MRVLLVDKNMQDSIISGYFIDGVLDAFFVSYVHVNAGRRAEGAPLSFVELTEVICSRENSFLAIEEQFRCLLKDVRSASCRVDLCAVACESLRYHQSSEARQGMLVGGSACYEAYMRYLHARSATRDQCYSARQVGELVEFQATLCHFTAARIERRQEVRRCRCNTTPEVDISGTLWTTTATPTLDLTTRKYIRPGAM